MSPGAKRIFKKIISWSGLVFFVIAAIALYMQLSKYPFADIKHALTNIPGKNLAYAALASILAYVALSSYDYLALQYIKRKLAAWKWIFVGFIGFSVSNNAGHAIVSGAAVRYRMYTRWRFKGSEIVKMVLFSGFTYLVACFALVIIGWLLTPHHALASGAVSKLTTNLTVLGSAVGLAVYFTLSIFYKKPFRLHDVQFKMPSFKMAVTQVVLGSADIVLASLVLYFVLVPFVDIPFHIFIGVFLIAQVLGVFSQIPGGLGVFEGLFIFILPGESNAAHLFGALIAYRVLYYLLPLCVSAVALFIYERRLRYKQKKALKWYQKEKQKTK